MNAKDLTKPAILFVGHGSRDVDAVKEFYQLAEHFKARFPDRLVETGFLEFVKPIIRDGVQKLMDQGVTHIQAIPGMLMAGGHAKNDIPSELNAIQKDMGIKIDYGSELGVDPKMLQAARHRIEECEAQFGDDYRREDTLLMVVGRGASDADANSNIAKITRFLEEGMGFGFATTSYSGVTTPLVPDALVKTYPMGFKKVIVFPYFMFTGRLVKKIYNWADEFQAAHPDVQVVKAPYLNDHPLVIDTFADSLSQIEEGSPNMNCQLCQYRVQIVGFEHKVGTPQESHHHHVQGIGTDADHTHSHEDDHSSGHDNSHSHSHSHEHGHDHHHEPYRPKVTVKSTAE